MVHGEKVGDDYFGKCMKKIHAIAQMQLDMV